MKSRYHATTAKLADRYFAEQCERLGPIHHNTTPPPKQVTRRVSAKRKVKP
jgi:hypothetical protein